MAAIPSYKELMNDINKQLATLRSDTPEVMAGFSALAQAATKDGALDKKTKEFLALAIAVAIRCDGCIGFHVKALVRLGATKQEIEEVLGMCIYLGGGPSAMYAANALAAFEELTAS